MSSPYNPEAFEPFEVDGFLFTGPLYCISPTPPPSDFTESCRAIVRVRRVIDGQEMRYVPAFTDLHQAEQFLDRRPNRGAGFNAIRSRTRREMALVLMTLALQGEHALGVDPDADNNPRLLPLAGILVAIGGDLA